MKIVLTTMPAEHQAISWCTPDYFKPKVEKILPLGILSLASNLPDDVECVILDPSSTGMTTAETINQIEKIKPDILGLSVVTVRAWAMKEILKKTSTPYKVVGGPHATHNAETILRQGANAVFIGPICDRTFRNAVETRPRGIYKCLDTIHDIQFPDRGKISLPFYYSTGNLFKATRRTIMFSSVGCPFHCRFCDVQWKHVQRKYPVQVRAEMQHLIDLGVESIHILDDNFNLDGDYVENICAEMQRLSKPVEWSARGMPRLPMDLGRLMVEHGFKRYHVGVESLNDVVLEWFGKPYRYKDIAQFCINAEKLGIDVLGYFILGSPVESVADRKNLKNEIRQLGIKYPYFNVLMPFPNTWYYNNLLATRQYKKDYWAEYIGTPTPDFHLPFPGGDDRMSDVMAFAQEMIDEFRLIS